MRIVLENVDAQYMSVINELAQALRFKVAKVERESKKAEIDRRIDRYEASQTNLVRPDWQKIVEEARSI